MIGTIDYHTHTILSDGHSSREKMIAGAIGKGFDEIGFSEHVYLKPAEWAMRMAGSPVMTRQIPGLREKYMDKIEVRLGIEVDYFFGI